jgi:hypothetical protein
MKMPTIISSGSGPISPDPDSSSPQPAVQHKEVIVTPNPTTTAQKRDNAQAERVEAAYQRQPRNAYPSSKPSKGKKKARRKLKRDARYRAVLSDLEAGRISPEEAKKRLPKRQKKTKTVE